MAPEKANVRDVDVDGKRVFVRVDFNVPIEDGRVVDDARIRAALPTIALLMRRGAKVILASHLGRPKGKVVDSLRLRPVAERLSQLLGQEVRVTGDALGVGTQDAIRRLKKGDVLLLENVRFHKEEEANDPEFAKQLASYADIYVNDAFGSAHRAHASTEGIAHLLPAYAGLLMEREIVMLSQLKVLENLLFKLDTLVLGGGMANTFLVAEGHTVGKSLLEADMVDEARRLLDLAVQRGVRLVLPVDVVVAKEVTRGAEHKIVPVEKIPNSWSIVDVGPASLGRFEEALDETRTILWNGPLGVFEIPTFGDGTRRMARYLAGRAEKGSTVVLGGGDSAAAVDQQGLAGKMTHVSTGGGATLEFLEGKELPGIAVLRDREVVEAAPGTAPAGDGAKKKAKASASASASKR